MAEMEPVPEAWIGQDVRLRYVDADVPRSLDCVLEEVNDRGVRVAAGEETSFFPWGNVIRLDLGHSRPVRGLRPR